MIETISGIFLIGGGLLGVIGGLGMHRFPDFYSRQHAAGVTDVLCAFLILTGLGILAGFTLASFKLFLIFIFLFFSSPAASHAVANAAMHAGLKPVTGNKGK